MEIVPTNPARKMFDLKRVILRLSKGLCYVITARTVEISLRLKPA